MSHVRLIATDLDGTLLDPAGRIPEAEADALRAASAAGVVIVVATGRPLRWLDVLAPIADADPLVVASNGAVVYDLHRDAVVLSHALPVAVIRALSRDLRHALPDLMFGLEEGRRFSTEDAWATYVPGGGRLADEEAATRRGPWPGVLDGAGDVVKFLALHPDADPDELVAVASEVVAGRAEVTHSVTDGRRALLEMSAPGISKAATIAELAAARGIRPDQVAAFGDMPNDLAMLEYAGLPYVMANGHPLLRERFPVIGSNADGGVGVQVRLLLGR